MPAPVSDNHPSQNSTGKADENVSPELLARLRTGEDAAFNELIELLGGRLFAVALLPEEKIGRLLFRPAMCVARKCLCPAGWQSKGADRCSVGK